MYNYSCRMKMEGGDCTSRATAPCSAQPWTMLLWDCLGSAQMAEMEPWRKAETGYWIMEEPYLWQHGESFGSQYGTTILCLWNYMQCQPYSNWFCCYKFPYLIIKSLCLKYVRYSEYMIGPEITRYHQNCGYYHITCRFTQVLFCFCIY
jgi:hypothetical protein